MSDPRRRIPGTDTVLSSSEVREAGAGLADDVVRGVVRAAQALARTGDISPEQVVARVVEQLSAGASTLHPVLNATGVVLHTNLGRAPLSRAAVRAVSDAAGYVDVEFDVGSGARARRGRGTLAALRDAVPEAGDVHVVNNGAAALVLATTSLAAGREVIVSRGEMVEIGDGFRLPDLIASTGARLREVGTTNRTHLMDYAGAVAPDTGCILKVHPSNFRVEGFTSEVGVADLAGLGVPVVVDIGSGLLAPHPLLPAEPDARTALLAGASVVTASGDKLLGGPQAGLLLGEAAIIDRLRRHPLQRAMRVDKLTLAALEATLRGAGTPVWDALTADPEVLHQRCVALADLTGGVVVASDGAVGGGGAPGLGLPGWAVTLPEQLAQPLRTGAVPVVGRVERGRLLLDLRCVPASRDADLVAAVRACTV